MSCSDCFHGFMSHQQRAAIIMMDHKAPGPETLSGCAVSSQCATVIHLYEDVPQAFCWTLIAPVCRINSHAHVKAVRVSCSRFWQSGHLKRACLFSVTAQYYAVCRCNLTMTWLVLKCAIYGTCLSHLYTTIYPSL